MFSALTNFGSAAASLMGFGRTHPEMPLPDQIDGLPVELQHQLCQHLGLADLVTLSSDRSALQVLSPVLVDRVARETLLQWERGEWESPADREQLIRFLAAHCRGQAFPHTQTLANVLDACESMSGWLRFSPPLEVMTLTDVHPISNALMLPVSGAAELPVFSNDLDEVAGMFLQSAEGPIRQPAPLVRKRFIPDSLFLSVADALCSRTRDALIVRDLNDGTLDLYSPSNDRLTPLPFKLAGTTIAALSADGRYVAAAKEHPPCLVVYDTMTRRIETDLPWPATQVRMEQVSVDCEGNVLLADSDDYVAVPRGTRDASTLPTIRHDDMRVVRFAPDGRHLLGLSQDCIHLVDKASGEVTTLRDPWARTPISVGFSPGNAMLSALYEDGELAVFDLTSVRPGTATFNICHLSSQFRRLRQELPDWRPNLPTGVTWFDQDGGAVRAAYAGRDDGSLVLARIPLTRWNG